MTFVYPDSANVFDVADGMYGPPADVLRRLAAQPVRWAFSYAHLDDLSAAENPQRVLDTLRAWPNTVCCAANPHDVCTDELNTFFAAGSITPAGMREKLFASPLEELVPELERQLGFLEPRARQKEAMALAEDSSKRAARLETPGSQKASRRFFTGRPLPAVKLEPGWREEYRAAMEQSGAAPEQLRALRDTLRDSAEARRSFEAGTPGVDPVQVFDFQLQLFELIESDCSDEEASERIATMTRASQEALVPLLNPLGKEGLQLEAYRAFWMALPDNVRGVALQQKDELSELFTRWYRARPDSSPGLWAWFAVERQTKRNLEAKAKPTDQPDRMHATFLPYVDEFFCDGATAEGLRQGAAEPLACVDPEDLEKVRRKDAFQRWVS